MVNSSSDQERDAVDLVTDCMFSLDFLRVITDVIFSEQRGQITVGNLYDASLAISGAVETKIPFSLGAVVSFLYCGLVLTKEFWDYLVPDEPVSSVDVDWALADITISAPKHENPSARYVMRRLRNALGHGNIRTIVPNNISDKSQIMQSVSFLFHDYDPRDPSDVFDAEAKLETLLKVVRKFHSEIHRHVSEKQAC